MDFPTVYTGNLSRTVRLSPRVLLRLGNLPKRDQCNTGIIDTGEGIVLVDYPEQDPADEILGEVQASLGKPVTHILLTHAHSDHRNGFAGLEDEAITILARANTLAEIRALFPRLTQPLQPVEPGDTMQIGGVELTFWSPSLLPAHSPWDMAIALPDDDVVFTGDFLVPPHYQYCFACNIANWLEGQAEFRSWNTMGILAMGHGDPEEKAFCGGVTLPYMHKLSDLYTRFRGENLAAIDESALPALLRDPLFQELSGASDEATVRRQLRELWNVGHTA